MANILAVADHRRTISSAATDYLITLSRRLARLSIDTDPESQKWFNDDDDPSDIPTAIGPFYISPARSNDLATGLWNVCAVPRDKQKILVLFADLPDRFSAFRKMVDVLEAWQIVKPIERVYFIGTELRAGEMVKVGFSRDPHARLRTLQTAHHERLQIFATAPGGKQLEEMYHRRWRARRRTGEWFVLGDCILAEIARVNAREA